MKQKRIDALYAFHKSLEQRGTRRVREMMRALGHEGIIKQGWVTKQGRVVYMDNDPNASRVELKGEFWIDSTCVVSQGKDLDHIEIHTPSRTWQFRIMNNRQKNSWYKRLTKVAKSRGTRSRGLPDVTFLHVMAPNGVAYRNTPDLKDRITEMRGPELGDVVKVAQLRDGWVQLDNGYWIPLKVGDVMTLRDTLPTIATANPSMCNSRVSSFSLSGLTEWPTEAELLKSSFFNCRTLTGTTLPPDAALPNLPKPRPKLTTSTLSSSDFTLSEDNAEVKPEELAVAKEAPDNASFEAKPEDKVPPNEDCDF